MLVVVNADDLGATPKINESIFAMMERGRVSSATLLSNGPAAEAALREAKRFSRCSFGVHLNLSHYEPLTSSPALSTLLENGGFSRARLQAAPRRPSLLLVILEEWRAQVRRVLDAGIHVSHIDSHHHVHTMPFLLPALKLLMASTGIFRIRISKNLYTPATRPPRHRMLEKAAFNAVLRHALPRARTTSKLTEVHSFFELLELGHAVEAPSVELMAHPGAEGDGYQSETMQLAGQDIRELCPDSRLVSYREI